MTKLCYVKKLNDDTLKLYFAPTDPINVWGDDWNDTPYEHNAGEPNDKLLTGKIISITEYILEHNGNLEVPCDNHLNSPYSVSDINHKLTPWLKVKTHRGGTGIFAGATLSELTEELSNLECDYHLWTRTTINTMEGL